MSLIATAPASSARAATSAEKVSAEIGSSVRAARPLDRRDQRCGLVLGAHRRPAARRHGADVEHLEARLGQRQRRPRPPARASRSALPRTSSRR